MKVYTYKQARDKVLNETGLTNEVYDGGFISPDELVGYFNDAIDEAEAEIHAAEREEEYFKKSSQLSLVSGQSSYSLPTDIYANKILGITYHKDSEIYPVNRIRRLSRFMEMEEILQTGAANRYKYTIQNADPVTGVQLVLFPASRETSSTVMKVWYIRNASHIPLIADGSLAATEATKIDIPEFISFIMAHVKVSCFAKEVGHPLLAAAAQKLEQQRQLMVDTLSKMVPDDNDTVEMDLSSYLDHE